MKNKKGFTLVELLIVIAVIGILFLVLVSRVDFTTDKAKTTGAKTDIRSLQLAVYHVGIQQSEFVSDLNLLADSLNKSLDSKLTLRVQDDKLVSMSKDPWGNEYILKYSKSAGTNGEIYILSAGSDQQFDTKDDIVSLVSCQNTSRGTNIIIKNDVNPNIVPDVSPDNSDNHVCIFNKMVKSNTYLDFVGNCAMPSTYFYSCECGNKGGTIFEDEKKPSNHIEHTNNKYEQLNESVHLKIIACAGCNTVKESIHESHTLINEVCSLCNQVAHIHVYDQQNVDEHYKRFDATCTTPAQYYYSCSCGKLSDSTFQYGVADIDNHTGNMQEDCVSVNQYQHNINTVCLNCNNIVNSTLQNHLFDNTKTCTECQNHTHEYNQKNNLHIQTVATCKTPASYYYECLCGDISAQSYVNEGELNYDNHEGIIVNGNEPNIHLKYNCCNKIESSEHSYQSNIVNDATCMNVGTTQYYCECGYNYVRDDIDIIDHIAELVGQSDIHSQCKMCKTVLETKHAYSEEVVSNGTCLVPGTKQLSCSCQYSYIVETTTTNHTINKNNVCSGCDLFVVPSGATYYVGVTSNAVGDYTGATEIYTAGTVCPTIKAGDVFVYNGYEYKYQYIVYYNFSATVESIWKTFNEEHGWGVRILNLSTTTPAALEENINGQPITNLEYAFAGSKISSAPAIPSTVFGDLNNTFWNCSYLTNMTKVVIPAGVHSMTQTYLRCTSLQQPPKVPDTVINMKGTYNVCSKITNVNYVTLPNNLKVMDTCFQSSGLTKAPKMRAKRSKSPNWKMILVI